jgi:hypothetical protein
MDASEALPRVIDGSQGRVPAAASAQPSNLKRRQDRGAGDVCEAFELQTRNGPIPNSGAINHTRHQARASSRLRRDARDRLALPL